MSGQPPKGGDALAWIGNPDTVPFYYRIHNPLVLIEFDHHSGVFLANSD